MNPSFKDFLSLSGAGEHQVEKADAEYHKISSVLCQSTYTSRRIIWTHSNAENGFSGRYDLPLITAVGVPIGSVGSDTYIILYFSIMNIPINPKSLDHLSYITQVIVTQYPSIIPVSLNNNTGTDNSNELQPQDLSKLIQQYSQQNKLKHPYQQKEIILFNEFYCEYKMKRKGNFTDQQIENLKYTLKIPSTTSSTSIINTTDDNKSIWLIRDYIQLIDAKDAGVYCIDDIEILSNQEKQNLMKAIEGMQLHLKNNPLPHEILNILHILKSKSPILSQSFRHIYAQMSYRLNQTRFHEFMIAILALTVFDSCELWLLSDHAASELHLTAAVYRNGTMQKWTSSGISLRLQVGVDVPGRVMTVPAAGIPTGGIGAPPAAGRAMSGGKEASAEDYCWDPAYCEEVPTQDTTSTTTTTLTENTTSSSTSSITGTNATKDTPLSTSLGSLSSPDFSRLRPGRNGPRMSFAKELGIHTALAVPVPGLCGSSGALVFYSTKQGLQLDAMFIKMVTTAVKLITETPLEPFQQGDGFSNKTISEKLLPSSSSSSSSGSSKDSTTVISSNPINSRNSGSFDQRLQLCQAILTSRRTGGAPVSLSEYPDLEVDRIGAALNYHPTQPTKDNNDIATATKSFNSSSESTKPTGSSAVTPSISTADAAAVVTSSIDPTGTSQKKNSTDAAAIDENLYSDAVVNAARALANFGNFKWGTFLEGSGLQDSSDGYQSMKLGSDQLLGVFTDPSASSSRKRKLPTRPAGSDQDSSDGLPHCLVAGCDHAVENLDVQYCISHRGTRRCQKEGCGKCAQGATKYCIAHGGGRRCTYPGCFKGARDKLFCAAHGGGKRCTHENCTKSAVGGSALCTAHGGGKRCQYEGCTKSSQSSTDYCVKHGGGRSCISKGCNKVSTMMIFQCIPFISFLCTFVCLLSLHSNTIATKVVCICS